MDAMRKLVAVALLCCVLPAAGCGVEIVVGGKDIVVGGLVTGDGGSGSDASGTVTVEARMELVHATGQTVPLSSGPGTVTVRIDGRDTTRLARDTVPDVEYTAVRVTFTRVEANVLSGLVIGGVNVTGRVSVDVSAGGVVVEKPLPLAALTDGSELLVDLDASDWLGAASPVTRLVSPSSFRDAVKIRLLE